MQDVPDAVLLSPSSSMAVDPLSEVLGVLGAQCVRHTRFEAAGDWALAFARRPRLKFVALLRGACWLSVADAPPRRLRAGDVFLIGEARYGIASDPGLRPADGVQLYREDRVRLGGEETVMVGGSLAFDAPGAGFLLDALPPFLHIGHGSPSAPAVSRVLASLDDELARPRIGGMLVRRRLAEILLVEAIRVHGAATDGSGRGWIAALQDRHIGAAIRAMHGEVGRRWTVSALAEVACLSRSAFAARFADLVGQPPLSYLTQWRMLRARRLLQHGDRSVARVADEVGYGSQSAFSAAFKRAFGHAPTRHAPRAAGVVAA